MDRDIKSSLKILYEDNDIIVCVKPVGTESEDLSRQLAEECCGGRRTYTVHRLDKPVGGLMVFAKNKDAAASLSERIAGGSFNKLYLAAVVGELVNACDTADDASSMTLSDLLYHDPHTNKTFVVKKQRKGVKEARLRYRVRESAEFKGEMISLVEVELITGRSHQVRVQFGSRKNPLWGDGKYGSRINGDIALFAYKLSFVHPRTQETVDFSLLPENKLPWSLFSLLNLP